MFKKKIETKFDDDRKYCFRVFFFKECTSYAESKHWCNQVEKCSFIYRVCKQKSVEKSEIHWHVMTKSLQQVVAVLPSHCTNSIVPEAWKPYPKIVPSFHFPAPRYAPCSGQFFTIHHIWNSFKLWFCKKKITKRLKMNILAF